MNLMSGASRRPRQLRSMRRASRVGTTRRVGAVALKGRPVNLIGYTFATF